MKWRLGFGASTSGGRRPKMGESSGQYTQNNECVKSILIGSFAYVKAMERVQYIAQLAQSCLSDDTTRIG